MYAIHAGRRAKAARSCTCFPVDGSPVATIDIGWCRAHGAKYLVQPHKSVDLDIGNCPDHAMEDFIKRRLEIEHGDLGLGTQLEEGLPPPSPLGLALKRTNDNLIVAELVRRLRSQAAGNIAMALLRLDSIKDARTVEDLTATADRLPTNIVENFNAGIMHLYRASSPPASPQAGERPGWHLGLAAIRHIGKHSITGTQLSQLTTELAQMLNHIRTLRYGSHVVISLDDILRAAGGFLISNNSGKAVMSYHQDFHLFINEDYNEILDTFAF
jgi:hypothetical protein